MIFNNRYLVEFILFEGVEVGSFGGGAIESRMHYYHQLLNYSIIKLFICCVQR